MAVNSDHTWIPTVFDAVRAARLTGMDLSLVADARMPMWDDDYTPLYAAETLRTIADDAGFPWRGPEGSAPDRAELYSFAQLERIYGDSARAMRVACSGEKLSIRVNAYGQTRRTTIDYWPIRGVRLAWRRHIRKLIRQDRFRYAFPMPKRLIQGQGKAIPVSPVGIEAERIRYYKERLSALRSEIFADARANGIGSLLASGALEFLGESMGIMDDLIPEVYCPVCAESDEPPSACAICDGRRWIGSRRYEAFRAAYENHAGEYVETRIQSVAEYLLDSAGNKIGGLRESGAWKYELGARRSIEAGDPQCLTIMARGWDSPRIMTTRKDPHRRPYDDSTEMTDERGMVLRLYWMNGVVTIRVPADVLEGDVVDA